MIGCCDIKVRSRLWDRLADRAGGQPRRIRGCRTAPVNEFAPLRYDYDTVACHSQGLRPFQNTTMVDAQRQTITLSDNLPSSVASGNTSTAHVDNGIVSAVILLDMS